MGTEATAARGRARGDLTVFFGTRGRRRRRRRRRTTRSRAPCCRTTRRRHDSFFSMRLRARDHPSSVRVHRSHSAAVADRPSLPTADDRSFPRRARKIFEAEIRSGALTAVNFHLPCRPAASAIPRRAPHGRTRPRRRPPRARFAPFQELRERFPPRRASRARPRRVPSAASIQILIPNLGTPAVRRKPSCCARRPPRGRSTR